VQSWDVVVVGGGPAGLAAAHAAATRGARTLVLERAEHPRYKTCGGGLIGTSLAAVTDMEVPVREHVHRATFTRDGRHGFTRVAAHRPLLAMVQRDEFEYGGLKLRIAQVFQVDYPPANQGAAGRNARPDMTLVRVTARIQPSR